jgi:hypothetical protein
MGWVAFWPALSGRENLFRTVSEGVAPATKVEAFGLKKTAAQQHTRVMLPWHETALTSP